MTPNNSSSSSRGIEERRKERGPGAMRVIVPLQGVVQGRGGFVLGSVIPCALFYFLQLYLRKNRSPPPTSPPPESPPQPQSSHSITPRKSTRSPTRPPFVSSRATHATDREVSLYYLGLKACEENPFDAQSNPDGIIQMGLAENQDVRDFQKSKIGILFLYAVFGFNCVSIFHHRFGSHSIIHHQDDREHKEKSLVDGRSHL